MIQLVDRLQSSKVVWRSKRYRVRNANSPGAWVDVDMKAMLMRAGHLQRRAYHEEEIGLGK